MNTLIVFGVVLVAFILAIPIIGFLRLFVHELKKVNWWQ